MIVGAASAGTGARTPDPTLLSRYRGGLLAPAAGSLVGAAREAAGRLLGDGLPDRWRHTMTVARRADQLSPAVDPADREILVAAAWLHDIGYAAALRQTGFHPLDGARWLQRQGWEPRICALVAHHSGARFVAAVRGIERQLAAYAYEQSPVSDALTYADQTVGVHGEQLPIRQRIAEMLRRHGPQSANAVAHREREPYLLAAARRVEARLARR